MPVLTLQQTAKIRNIFKATQMAKLIIKFACNKVDKIPQIGYKF